MTYIVSFTLPRLYSANAMFMRHMTRRGKRRLLPAYLAWRDEMGWVVKMQTAGVAPIACRFDLTIRLPPTRMDHDNIVKPILDLGQKIWLITNDRNMNAVSVAPAERDDCLVVLTLRPELGGRPAVKRRREFGAAPAVKPSTERVRQTSAIVARYLP